jgi:hypothetical protein
MSAEFNNFISGIADLTAEVEDKRFFTIAERRALDLLLDGLKDRNLRMLSFAENGRAARKPY